MKAPKRASDAPPLTTVSVDLLVKDALAGVVARFEQLLGQDTEAICTALAFLAAGAECELKCRLPLDNPALICNTRAMIEQLSDAMSKKLLDNTRPHGIIEDIDGQLDTNTT